MKNAKQIIWRIAKWSSIAAVVAVVYSSYIEQDKVTQQFIILGGLMFYLTFIIVKRIDGTNIAAYPFHSGNPIY